MPSSLAQYKGANPNSVMLWPDEKQLYATLGNLNCIAVVAMGGKSSGDQIIGLIPTGWLSVARNPTGRRIKQLGCTHGETS